MRDSTLKRVNDVCVTKQMPASELYFYYATRFLKNTKVVNWIWQLRETIRYLFSWKFIHRARELLQLSLSKFQSAMRMFHLKRRQSVQLSLGNFFLCLGVKLCKLFLSTEQERTI